MTKRIVIATGGTGGHVYPAIALADQLDRKGADISLLFMGGGLANNPYFASERFAFHNIPAANLAGGLLSKLKASTQIVKGILDARCELKRFKPDLVIGFGSYHSYPVLAAARLLKIPLVLHEANSIPGRVNRRFSRYARITGIQFPEAADRLQGRSMEVVLPLREGYALAFGSRERALEYFGLDPDLLTLLVFGGSQGALVLNAIGCSAICHELGQVSRLIQVIHLTGNSAQTEKLTQEYQSAGIRACVKDFEPNMDYAWLASDLAITRAGASTIAEQLEFEVPAIFVPYPHAKDAHQEHNANFVVHTVKGAMKLPQDGLEAIDLANAIRGLVRDEHRGLREMRQALKQYKETHRTRDLCSLVCEVGGIPNR